MKRHYYAVIFVTLIVLFSACKKTGSGPIGEEIDVTVTITQIVAQPDEIRMKFKHGGGVDAAIGMVHGADSASVINQIKQGSKELLTRQQDGGFAYTFDRADRGETVYYAFFIETQGRASYSEVQTAKFGAFKFLELGFTEKDVLGSIASEYTDADVQYHFVGAFEDFAELKFFINDIERPYTYIGGAEPTLSLSVPPEIRAGFHTYRMTYRGNEVIRRTFYMPQGRLRLAGVHPQGHRQVLAHYLYGQRIGLVSRLYDPYRLEYAFWDPATDAWDIAVADYDDLVPISANQWSNGVELDGKIYLPPSLEIDEDSQEPAEILRTFDPVSRKWTRQAIKFVTAPTGLFSLHFQNMYSFDNKLYILQYGDDGIWPSQAFHVYRYDPANESYTSFARLPLPSNAVSARLVTDGNDFYVIAYLDYKHPYYWWDYEVSIYRTDAELNSLTLLATEPTKSTEGHAFVMDGKIYVYGGQRKEVLQYETAHFGGEYDLATGEWKYLNPTYADYQLPTEGYWSAMFIINGRIFNGLTDNGEIIEWDVNYRK